MNDIALAGAGQVTARYMKLVREGAIVHDADQSHIAAAMDVLTERIVQKRMRSKSSALGWLFARRPTDADHVRGLYVHGGVGRGKTMLMDLFFDALPVDRKRRAHFNDFMADVHDRIAAHRTGLKDGTVKGDDPIPPVAAAIAAESWVICFDEFTVTDIADAMILSRLFAALFEKGVVLIATSNVAPGDLYKDGLNRSLFTPFITILERHSDVMTLDHETDYRLQKLNRLPVYVSPLDADARQAMDDAWATLCEGHIERSAVVEVTGRELQLKRTAGSALRVSFAELCEMPLGARDYMALAARFSAFVIDDIPVMEQADRNAAKRFILLIDTLYNERIRLFASAAAIPQELYRGRSGTEKFEFDRTVSRLIEMQSQEWNA